MKSDTLSVRVYYEDTDLAGIVYYANYLKYIERGRTEYLRARGVDQRALRARTGLVFAVRRVVAEYLRPALMDDLLTVETRLGQVRGARLEMAQEVRRGEEILFTAEVTIACLDSTGRPARVPSVLRDEGAG